MRICLTPEVEALNVILLDAAPAKLKHGSVATRRTTRLGRVRQPW
ncbi:hypothetical protein [Leptolyngbya sp. FACHB-261]|nr:hypothetical protein [Leptolyngbya sp. FACHB-261]